MKIDRKTIEEFKYTLEMNGEEFSLIKRSLFAVSVDEEFQLPFRNSCRALYAEMTKELPSLV